MPKFDELGYGGGELTCSLCNFKLFYANFNRYRYSDYAEYEWGYQCQECGEVIMSKEQYDDRPYILERCNCGGQFRRDKNLFCKNCKGNKTDENVSDEFVTFKHENGEPKLIKHKTSDERKGELMSKEELHRFGVDLLSKYFKSQGHIIIDTDDSLNGDNPNIIFKSINDKYYYIVVETASYPTVPNSLIRNEFPDVVYKAKFFAGNPAFAGMSFANLTNKNGDLGELICGDCYAVALSNLFILT